jgi:lipopolysaccharide/colanic/teichoic acid biosynthesis glycosyltransferase
MTTSAKLGHAARWASLLLLGLAGAAAAWLGPLAWRSSILASMASVFVGHGLLALSVIVLNRPASRGISTWAYRGGFLISVALGVVRLVSLPAYVPGPLLHLALIVLGTYAGCLEATRRTVSLWEDNFPPGEALSDRVRLRHEVRLGPLRPTRPAKRAFDLALAVLGSVVALPVATMLSMAVWIEDPGPLLFAKNSVGRGGRNFRQWKMRTMVRAAEAETGPVLAAESDERVLWTGRWLRKTALDELPQLLNILQGSMSFVGPRPQRTVLVAEYLERIPEFTDRHAVAPGLAGLAQVAGDYYLTPRQKLRYDRLYVNHAGLAFDLKLIALAFATVFWLRWTPGWKGRVPSRWIRWPKRRKRPS